MLIQIDLNIIRFRQSCIAILRRLLRLELYIMAGPILSLNHRKFCLAKILFTRIWLCRNRFFILQDSDYIYGEELVDCQLFFFSRSVSVSLIETLLTFQKRIKHIFVSKTFTNWLEPSSSCFCGISIKSSSVVALSITGGPVFLYNLIGNSYNAFKV